MSFMDAIKSGFSNYFNFRDRAARSEYWFWVLFVIIAGIVLSFVDASMFGAGEAGSTGPLSAVFSLATFIPGLALLIRRLHDLDRTGWWALICLVPFIGWIVIIVFAATKGTEGDNRFGADPLGGQSADPSDRFAD